MDPVDLDSDSDPPHWTLQHEISEFRYCYECVNKATGARHCLVCGSEEETHLLLCNSCPRAYHTSCLTPPLAKVTLLNSLADPGVFLTPGSGMGKKNLDPDPG